MQYKGSNINTKFPADPMGATTAPIAIGTKGTVGSLVRKEIEYFTMFELDRRQPQAQRHVVEMGSSSSSGGGRPAGFWSLRMRWKRKQRKVGIGFLPRICSAVDVADGNGLNGIPGFNYRTLKNDLKDVQY